MPLMADIEGMESFEIPDNATDLQVWLEAQNKKLASGEYDPLQAEFDKTEALIESYGEMPVVRPMFEQDAPPPDRGLLGEAWAGIKAGILSTVGGGMAGLERWMEVNNIDPDGEEAGMLRRAGQSMLDSAAELKSSEDIPDWYFKTFNAFGSVLSFFAPALLAGAATAAAPLVGLTAAGVGTVAGLSSLGLMGAMGSGAHVHEAYERAKDNNASPEQIQQAANLAGFVLGPSELLAPVKVYRGLSKFFPALKTTKGLGLTSSDKIRQATKSSIGKETLAKNLGIQDPIWKEYGKRMALTAGLEGSQEAAAAVGQNAIEKYIHNPEADLTNLQTLEEGLYGGAAGAMLESVLSLFTMRKSRAFRKNLNEFTNSREYKGIEDEANSAAEEYEKAEAKGDEKGMEAAGERLLRANEATEAAVKQRVFNTPELFNYLADETDADGNRIYSKSFLLGMQREGRLEEVYERHVFDPATKYEADAMDKLFLNNMINPFSGKAYDVAEADALQFRMNEKAKGKEETAGDFMNAEVRFREDDVKAKLSNPVQQAKITGRVKHNISQLKLNEMLKKYGDEAFVKYIQRLEAGETQTQLNKILKDKGAAGLVAQGAVKTEDALLLEDKRDSPKQIEDATENIMLLEDKYVSRQRPQDVKRTADEDIEITETEQADFIVDPDGDARALQDSYDITVVEETGIENAAEGAIEEGRETDAQNTAVAIREETEGKQNPQAKEILKENKEALDTASNPSLINESGTQSTRYDLSEVDEVSIIREIKRMVEGVNPNKKATEVKVEINRGKGPAGIRGQYSKNENKITIFTQQIARESKGQAAFRRLVNATAAHEAFHAAKETVFTPEQLKYFNENVTVELAVKNGFDANAASLQGKPAEEVLEEAQAFLYENWYNGESVADLSPRSRSMFNMLREFFQKVYNYMKGRGFIISDKKMQEMDDKGLIKRELSQQFQNFRDGSLATHVGRLDPNESAATYAANKLPQNSEDIIRQSAMDYVRKAFTTNTNGREADNAIPIMQDIGWFAYRVSHVSSLAQRLPLIKTFYNLTQDRVRYRNKLKGGAESITTAGNLLKRSDDDLKRVGQLSILADEAQTAPEFDIDNGTVTINIPADRVAQIKENYESLERFLLDTAIEPEMLVGSEEQGFTVTVDNPELVRAFAGTTAAIKFIGEEKTKALLHNLINTGVYRNKVFIRSDGTFNEAMGDVDAFLDSVNEAGLVTDTKQEGDYPRLNKKAYEAYVKNFPQEEKTNALFGGLDSKNAASLYTMLRTLRTEGREGYFPHYRFGDHAVAVYKKDEDGKSKLIRLQTAESKLADAMAGTPFADQALTKMLNKEQNKLHQQLSEEFSGPEYVVAPFVMTFDNIRNSPDATAIMGAMGTLETMAAVFQGRHKGKNEGTSTTYHKSGQRDSDIDSFVDMVRTRVSEQRVQQLLRTRENIPGYIHQGNNDGRYFKLAFQRFIDHGSNLASSLMTEPDILDSLEEIRTVHGPASNIYDFAKGHFDYINQPNNEATGLRSFAFHMFLGFNMSSAAVNATQTIQGTYPIMAGIVGPAKAGLQLGRAIGSVGSLYKNNLGKGTRLGKYGYDFFKSETLPNGEIEVTIDQSKKPKGWTAEEYDFIASMFLNGEIQPIQNMDLGMEGIKSYIPGDSSAAKAGRIILDTSGYAFGMVENSNRIIAALTAYRTAKDPSNRPKVVAFLKSTRFADASTPFDTMSTEEVAELLGRAVTEKSQFFMGKENRPVMFRGPFMSMATQFWSFPFQMVGMYADVLNKTLGSRLDVEGLNLEEQRLVRKMAATQLGMMTLGLVAFAGAMGLPFMENIKQLIQIITRNNPFGDKIELDVEQWIREAAGPVLGYNATDMMLTGLFGHFAGIDIQRRTGLGDIIPLRYATGGDPTVFLGPAGARIFDMIRQMNFNIEQGNVPGIVASALPIGLANMIKATFIEPQRGTFTMGGQQLLPPNSLNFPQKFASFLGFTPKEVGEARTRRGQDNYYRGRAKNGKEMISQKLTTYLSGAYKANEAGDYEKAARYYADYLDTYLASVQHDLDNMEDPSSQYRIQLPTIQKRAMRDTLGLDMWRMPKAVRPQIYDGILRGYIAARDEYRMP